MDNQSRPHPNLSDEVNGNVILPEPPDSVRLKITELTSELLPRVDLWGIGYENFQNLYQQRYGEAVVREILGASFLEETVVAPSEVG